MYASIIDTMKNKRLMLKNLKDLLVANFGRDIKDVVLFGSRATGKAHKHSDYDVLIILNRDYDWEYKKKIISVVCDVELEYDIFIDTKIISNHELYYTIKGKNPLYADALREGIHA